MAARRSPVLLGRADERQVARPAAGERARRPERRSCRPRRGGRRQDGPAALLRPAGVRLPRRAGSPASSPRWSCRSRGCISSARRCSSRLDALPEPQQDALGVALGLASGDAPDRFLVALAALSLLAEVAAERPLLCLVDDAQWLDAASRQVLGFVARRLLAESVAIVFAVRDPTDERELAGLPELALGGLADDDARALLATVIPGRLDERVRDRLVAETRGNPLALLELPRGLAATQLPGGFGLPERACRCRGGSRRASCGGSRSCRRRRGCCCWSRRRSRSATRR